MSVAPLASAVLATSGEAMKSGPIGLAVILVLCIGCYFLFKSMSKHLRKVREAFPEEPDPKRPVRPDPRQFRDGASPASKPTANRPAPAQPVAPDRPDQTDGAGTVAPEA